MALPEARHTRHRFALSKERIPEFVLGIAATILGAYVAYEATTYSDGSAYDSLGPSLMPIIISLGLVVSGFSIAWNMLGPARDENPAEPMDWAPVAWIAVGIAIPIVLLTTLGWIPVIAV